MVRQISPDLARIRTNYPAVWRIRGLKLNFYIYNQMQCEFCNNIFVTKSGLNNHQKRAKYCLAIRGVKKESQYICEACGKSFSGAYELKRHLSICQINDKLQKYKEQNETMKEENLLLKKENEMLRAQLVHLQEDYKDLSLTAVKRPTISNKTMNINNFIKNMQPLTVQDIESSVPMLTLEHHAKGAEGYAEFALEFPFKDKIVCVDVSRNKIKYKNDEGDIIEDVGFRKMMTKLCNSLQDRSFNLSLAHEEKLSETWTEKEREAYDFMEAAIAIAKYAKGRENEFCSKIIKLISKGAIKK